MSECVHFPKVIFFLLFPANYGSVLTLTAQLGSLPHASGPRVLTGELSIHSAPTVMREGSKANRLLFPGQLLCGHWLKEDASHGHPCPNTLFPVSPGQGFRGGLGEGIWAGFCRTSLPTCQPTCPPGTRELTIKCHL